MFLHNLQVRLIVDGAFVRADSHDFVEATWSQVGGGVPIEECFFNWRGLEGLEEGLAGAFFYNR